MHWKEPDGEEPAPGVQIRPYLRAVTPAEQFAGPAPTPEATLDPAITDVPRPFVLTSGRVAGTDPSISLETQVTARHPGLSWDSPGLSRLTPEMRNIVLLCAEPLSVAEVSAQLQLQLGVTKVLVGDLRAAGYLDVHVRHGAESFNPDVILRVIDGLSAIS
ncbi:hypothetical protein C7C45_11325 [Micromonospora arborensis]|uniref:DUF742 domain-containing protein n=1 Tax=Micromonospora arborensis TaxID=2116518 RepID=A0A318NWU7_9ACTN|nr:DUF742 domain-containing protein [Micromonospora arborensis]PYC71610.1 hypothetical protein C7C45_11325 [Micromonospora arborensis]